MNKARRWGNEESKTPNKTGNSGWQNIHTVMKTAALTGNFLRYNRKLTMDIVAMLTESNQDTVIVEGSYTLEATTVRHPGNLGRYLGVRYLALYLDK